MELKTEAIDDGRWDMGLLLLLPALFPLSLCVLEFFRLVYVLSLERERER